jgi:hypothetical protein
MDSVCHVIKRILNPGFFIYMSSPDVASTIHQSLGTGGGARTGPVLLLRRRGWHAVRQSRHGRGERGRYNHRGARD